MQEMAAKALMYLVIDYPASIEAHSTAWTDLPLIAGASFTSMSKIPFESVHQAG
jgi:peptide/nickel transport system substrate-binding protein